MRYLNNNFIETKQHIQSSLSLISDLLSYKTILYFYCITTLIENEISQSKSSNSVHNVHNDIF